MCCVANLVTGTSAWVQPSGHSIGWVGEGGRVEMEPTDTETTYSYEVVHERVVAARAYRVNEIKPPDGGQGRWLKPIFKADCGLSLQLVLLDSPRSCAHFLLSNF